MFAIVAFSLIGCNAFKHGYTLKQAQNSYQLITGDEKNFGDKRLKYNKGFHKNSELSNFLDCKCNHRGQPSFIYEFTSETRCRGIKLYYAKLDSVFVFVEPKKNNLRSVLTETRKMNAAEKQAYEGLKAAK